LLLDAHENPIVEPHEEFVVEFGMLVTPLLQFLLADHVIGRVPEALTAKPFGVEAQKLGQHRTFGPFSHSLFAGGMLQAVDDGQHEIEPARDAIALTWDMGLKQVD